MGILDIFRTKQAEKNAEIVEEADDGREMQRAVNRSSAERRRIDLENWKLEALRKKEELEDELEEARAERHLRRLEREARIRQLEQELTAEDEPEGDSPEMLLMSMLAKTFNKSQSPATGSTSEGSSSPQPVAFSPEKIKQIWENMPPAHREIAKKMTDEQLRLYIINNIPNIDAQSVETAIVTVRGSQ